MLRCLECGAVSVDGAGWRAYTVHDPDHVDDGETIAIYCASCAEREFGAPAKRDRAESE